MLPPMPLLCAAAGRPLVLGLTGSIGVGKSTATAWFRKSGFKVHDSDAAVHELYSPGGAAVGPVASAFPEALSEDGGINRTALSQAVIVAGRETSLATLEKIVHPLVAANRAEFVRVQGEAGEWLVVVDVPLLFETCPDEASLREQVDQVLVVTASAEIQRQRVMRRPGMTEAKLDAILARQVPDAIKRRRADMLVDTGLSDGFSETRAQLAGCVERLICSYPERWHRWVSRCGPGEASASAAGASAAALDNGTGDGADETDSGRKSGRGGAKHSVTAERVGGGAGGGAGGGGGGSGGGSGCSEILCCRVAWGGVRCVTLDLDETLWPCAPPILAASERLSATVALAMPRAAAAGAATTDAMRAATKKAMASHPLLSHDFTQLRIVALRELRAEHGDELSDAQIDQIVHDFTTWRSDVEAHLFDDVVESVRELRAAGIIVGAVTDGNTDVSRAGELVSSLFDFAITAADAGASKESAAPFLQAAAAAGCHPSQMVHVGDSVTKDLLGALRCGMRAVLCERAGHVARSDADTKALPPRDDARWRQTRTLRAAADLVLMPLAAQQSDTS